MRIFTASWYTPLPPDIKRIGTSRGTPRGQKAGYKIMSDLKPGAWFNSVSPAEYVQLYYSEVLAPIDPTAIVERLRVMGDGRDVALLCYEKPPFSVARGNWCHRRIAASALERALGVEIPEYLPPGIVIGDTVPTAAGPEDWAALAAGAPQRIAGAGPQPAGASADDWISMFKEKAGKAERGSGVAPDSPSGGTR